MKTFLNKNTSAGITTTAAVWTVVGIVVIALAIFGGMYLSYHAQQQGSVMANGSYGTSTSPSSSPTPLPITASTPVSQASAPVSSANAPVSPVSTPVSPASAPVSSASKNVCDYLTASDISSILGPTVQQSSIQTDSQMCLYSDSRYKEGLDSVSIMVVGAPSAESQGMYQQILKNGAKSLTGIGDMAAEWDRTSSSNSVVVIYFFKDGTVGTITLAVRAGQTMTQVSTQAQSLAKLIINKI
jgi:hypothetical protein